MRALLLAICVTLPVYAAHRGIVGSVCSQSEFPESIVEVTGPSTLLSQTVAYHPGVFRFEDLAPGRYSIRVRAQGLRDAIKTDVDVVEGAITDVGAMRLIAECEVAPNSICVGGHFVVYTDPPDIAGALTLSHALCDMTIASFPFCESGHRQFVTLTDERARQFDFRSDGSGLYLTPFEGVLFSVNPKTVTVKRGCADADYKPGPIRIDNLAPGSRACIRTPGNSYIEIRFPHPIKPGDQTVSLDYALLNSDH